MYKKGMLEHVTKPCDTYEDGWCDNHGEPGHKHSLYETGELPVAFLPHSCDEWVIGGREEVSALIADLKDILRKL